LEDVKRGCFHIWLPMPALWANSCSPNLSLTVHDEDAASLVASNFLHAAFYQHNAGNAYDTTDPRFKTGATRADFIAGIEKTQTLLSPTNFVITDFSTWGAEQTIAIYGNSQTSVGAALHFRCLLTGTKAKGYTVTRLDCSTKLPQKTGINVRFKTPVTLGAAQPVGAADGSQPFRSETNTALSTAGSRR
jgi:hypothetical protein